MDQVKRVLEGIKQLKWGESECTFVGALDATLQYMGEDVDYIELMGMSAAAFRMHFHPEWCPSSPDWFPRKNSARFLGYNLHEIGLRGDSEEDLKRRKEESLKISKKEIDEGRPVIAIDLVSPPDWGVITGYVGEKLLCQTYNGDFDENMFGAPIQHTEGYAVAHNYPWELFTLEKTGSIPSRREMIEEALKLAIEQFDLETYEGQKSGRAAFEYWISQLRNEEVFGELDEGIGEKWHVNAWVYDSLMDARTSAQKFLDRIAPEFEGGQREALERAKSIYEEINKILWENWVHFPFRFWVRKDEGNIWIPGDRFVEGTTWTKEMRTKGAEVLEEVLKKEEEAIKLLEGVV